MMRWVGLGMAMAALSTGFLSAGTCGHVAAATKPSAYDLSDKNGDGQIDREEYHRRMTDVFFFTDGDKDHHLTMHELSDVSEKQFKAADRNRDGKLSLSEYINARFKAFHAADHDRDGMLSREEVKIP